MRKQSFTLILILIVIGYNGLISNQYLLDSNFAFNGTIKTIINHNGINYVGGSFTKISHLTGFGALVDKNNGDYQKNFPKINGRVNVAIPDGSGGFYIGGEFTKVGNFNRLRLAQIDADGNVTSFAPNVNMGLYPYVYDMILYQNKLYIVGSFNGINSVSRKYAACVDLNGNVTSWNPNADDEVLTVAASNNVIYIGGAFLTISGQSRNFGAALDLDGNLLAWNPDANNRIRAIAITGNSIYIAGSFTRLKTTVCSRAAVMYPDGSIGSFLPAVNNTVDAISIYNNIVYFGGRFTKIGTQTRNYLGAVDTNGTILPWNPSANATVFKIKSDNSGVYAGGSFTKVTNQNRSFFVGINHDGSLKTWNPNANSTGYAISVGDTSVFIGGVFSGLGGSDRNYIAAIDNDGNILPWNPNPNNEVYSIFAKDTSIYFSGVFTKIGVTNLSYFATVGAVGGSLLNWRPAFDGVVYGLKFVDNKTFVAGSFSKINGTSRKYIGAFDDNGNLTNFNPAVNSAIFAMDAANNKIYIGGFFSQVNGQQRNRLACLNPDGSLDSFNPNADDAILALTIFKNKIYVGGWFTNIGGQSRSRLAALNPDGSLVSWTPNPNNAVWSILVVNQPFDVIYVGGDFTQISGITVYNLAGFDISGTMIPWYPNPDKSVYAIAANSDAVFTGGLFLNFEDQMSPNFAMLSTYTEKPGLPSLISPADGSVKIPVLGTFEWTPTNFTSRYRIQFSTNSDFTNIISDKYSDLTTFTFQTQELLFSTKHYWRVRAENADEVSAWSEVWSFTTRINPPGSPTLTSPADGTVDVDFDAQISWQSPGNTDFYQLYVSDDQDSNNVIFNDSSITDTFTTLPGDLLDPAVKYYWKVRGVNESGPGTWSDVWNFTTVEFYSLAINLTLGWNLISSNIIPRNDSMEVIFKDIINNILIVKNSKGQVYIPAYGINTIGVWDPKQAYYVYASQAITLNLLGYRMNPTEHVFNLVSGWNQISYLRNSPMDVSVAYNAIKDAGKLVIVKDGAGNVYLPDFGINNIGNLITGKGYLIYVNSNFNFTYPAND